MNPIFEKDFELMDNMAREFGVGRTRSTEFPFHLQILESDGEELVYYPEFDYEHRGSEKEGTDDESGEGAEDESEE